MISPLDFGIVWTGMLFSYLFTLCAVQNINTKASVSAQKHRGAFGGGLVSYLRFLYFLRIVMSN
jgi:hypothetical protein